MSPLNHVYPGVYVEELPMPKTPEDRAALAQATGTDPGVTIDPLDLISSFAGRMASEMGSARERDGAWFADRGDIVLLEDARRLLILNAHHVPLIVDEVLTRSKA